MRNQGNMFTKCVAIFPNTESSNNKHGHIGTVNSKNWLYPVLLGDKYFCDINKLIQKLHFLTLGRGEYLYPFVAMQLFNDEDSNHNFVYHTTINCFPRIFIILSKHNFSESEFSRSPLKGN